MVLTYGEWDKVRRDMKRRKTAQCKRKKYINIKFLVVLWRKVDGTTKRVCRVESVED